MTREEYLAHSPAWRNGFDWGLSRGAYAVWNYFDAVKAHDYKEDSQEYIDFDVGSEEAFDTAFEDEAKIYGEKAPK